MSSLFGVEVGFCFRRADLKKLSVFVQLRPRPGEVDSGDGVMGAERYACRANPNSLAVELGGPFTPGARLVLGGAVRGGSQVGSGGTSSFLSSRPAVIRRLLVLSIL